MPTCNLLSGEIVGYGRFGAQWTAIRDATQITCHDSLCRSGYFAAAALARLRAVRARWNLRAFFRCSL